MNRQTTDALLLRKVERGDANLVLTFFTEKLGTVTAIAYSARRSKKRFAVLEPFHTLRIEVDDAAKDMAVLREATVPMPRTAFLSSLDRMQAASRALGWARATLPPHAPDAAVWSLLTAFLDMAASCEVAALENELAAFGLNLLRVSGLCPPPSRVRQGMTANAVIGVVESVVKDHGG